MVKFLALVEQDIEGALLYTAREFGTRKYADYAALIEEALEVLAEEPTRGRRRPEIHRSAWTYAIAKPGRRARHVFLYRLADDGSAVIYGLLYDGMNLPEHWRSRESQE